MEGSPPDAAALPCYSDPRSAGKVIRAVNSILSQNFKGDLEVIVVDDGSSPPITLPPELASDPRARIVRKERTAGPGAARNTGLTLAGGEWAGFLDSDDYLLPDTLNQRFADAVEDQRQRNNPLVLYTCGWAEVSQGGEIQRMRHPRAPANREGFAGGCWFCAGSTLLFRRAPVLQAVGLQDERPPRLEDCDWTLRFGLADGELVVQPVVAAAIEISNRPSAPKIYSGCEILAAKWQKEFTAGHLTAPLYHRLKAYLHLERGLAALTAGRRGAALYYWARSWLERPRMTWHASPGSQQVEPAGRAIPRD
jgi:glycosyltransferase involved in cell wall biosynthesis